MVSKDNEPEPYELVQTLRDKLIKANLNREQLERLRPASLSKKDHINLPPYEVGSYKKQREAARLRLEMLEKQRHPGYVSIKQQERYLNWFYKLKDQGKLSHLTPEMIKKLEEEIKASAADSKKHAELEEFLSSLDKEPAVPEPPANVSTEHTQNTSQGDVMDERNKKRSIVNIQTDDGSMVPCVAIFSDCSLTLRSVAFCPDSLCEGPVPQTEKKEPIARKGPVIVSSRTVPEVLDALNLVTEYIQQHDLVAKHLEGLRDLERNLRQGV